MIKKKRLGMWSVVLVLMVIFSSWVAALYETPISVTCSEEHSLYPCTNANNGVLTGADFWAPAYDTPLPHWIYGDLGTAKTISGVRSAIYWYHVPMTMDIQVSNDASTWTTVEPGWEITTHSSWVEKTFSSVIARYVRFSITSGQTYTGILDIEVITGAAAPPTCTGCSYVFVTSQTYTGALGGLGGADALCQDEADNAGLTGTYKAWLSDSTPGGSAAERFTHSTVPYKLVDGTTLIADDWNDLVTADPDYLDAPINKDTGGNIVSTALVWTGTGVNGMVVPNYHCNDWGDTSGDGRHGYTIYTSNLWTSGGSQPCSTTQHLFCFEQPPAICGNNVKEGTEQCDGTALAGQTCISQGFVGGGTLACLADCSAFDTSGCSMCAATETICTDNIDNDCNGESDYDDSTSDGLHGDSSCEVGVTAISVSDATPVENTNIDVECTSTVANVNSISAYIDTVPCAFTAWNVATAKFSCNVGAYTGISKTAKCIVDTAKSYALAGFEEQTTTIDVSASACSGYLIDTNCEGDSLCDWCPECMGTKYTGSPDICVDSGNCPTSYCWWSNGGINPKCGAQCDDTNGGCTDTICDDYCDGNNLITRGDEQNFCELNCLCTANPCSVITTTLCGTETCDTLIHLEGSCDKPCNEAGTPNDGTDAACGTCTPTYPADCSCIASYVDADGNPTNGCECFESEPTTETSCTDNIDNDCDTLIDCLDPDCQTGENNLIECNDGVDNDCDGLIDCYDNDCINECECIVGDPDQTTTCGAGGCVVTVSQTCNNGAWDPVCTPSASVTETCNNLDDNCDGNTDEGCDDDGDNYCDSYMIMGVSSTECPSGGGDCDDENSNVYLGNSNSYCDCDNSDGSATGVPEICDNNIDNDCDGSIEEGCDGDSDTYCDNNMLCVVGFFNCDNGECTDCDDTDLAINPLGTETCDFSDNNCDGQLNEGVSGCNKYVILQPLVFNATIPDAIDTKDIISYTWDFDDGTSFGTSYIDEALPVEHAYTSVGSGNYNVLFRIMDKNFGIYETSMTITVGKSGSGGVCTKHDDCLSDFCNPTDGKCAVPDCNDEFKNQDETDVDCGGDNCAQCDLFKECGDNDDCLNNNCVYKMCMPKCDNIGFGYVDTGFEVCDGSNKNSEDCQSQGFDSGQLTCLSDCSGFDTSQCFYICGDGNEDPGEECDDGCPLGTAGTCEVGVDDVDYCLADCTENVCRDGIWQSIADGSDIEECDDGNAVSGDGCSYGCLDEYCGDGTKQDATWVDNTAAGVVAGGGEECDTGTARSDITPDACRMDCKNPSCGDNVIDTGLGEECDDGNTDIGDGCSRDCGERDWIMTTLDISCTDICDDRGETCYEDGCVGIGSTPFCYGGTYRISTAQCAGTCDVALTADKYCCCE